MLQEFHISGYLTAEGRGYRGGQRPTAAGANGLPGESYHSESRPRFTLTVFYRVSGDPPTTTVGSALISH